MNTIKTEITKFLKNYIKGIELDANEDIFELGYINSLFAMELIMFVESNFSITVENEDLEIDNFRTINSITDLVEKKIVVKDVKNG